MIHKLKAQCSKKQLREIRGFVEKVLKSHAMSDIEAYQIVLAVDEICANLIVHSHQCNAEESFEVSIDYKEDKEIIFEIVDEGMAFSLNQYAEPNLKEVVKKKQKGGLGLMLVHRIMDKIEFIKRNNKNVCLLSKKLD